MHDLAELTYDPASEVDWSECPLVDGRIDGWIAFRAKRTDRAPGPATLPLPGTVSNGVIGIAPGDWLVLGAPETRTVLSATIATAGAVATEVSDALLTLDCGDRHAVFAQLTGIDPACFSAGHAAMTKLAGIPVLLTTDEQETRLQLIFDASYDRHMRDYLNKAI